MIALLSAVVWMLWPTANVVSDAKRFSGWDTPAQVRVATNAAVLAQLSPDTRSRRSDGPWFVFVIIIFVVVILAAIFFSGTCPQCQRRRALKTTGHERSDGGWFSTTEQEWRCRHCGYTEWKQKSSGGGGGASCSGGGCGG